MTGIELLREVRQQAPDAKLVLLTAYADTDVAIRAINDIALDYYLLKPWDPPEDRLYPVLDELLGDWANGHPDRDSEVRVVGHRWSERTHDVKTFLTHNHVPYRWLEVGDAGSADEATRLLELAQAGADDLPVVALPDGAALRSPTTVELAGALGLRTRAEQPLYDLCIVGGGPAGLAAAVYAASEGLATVVVERDAPGGQAGQSASIENYLGFPKGLSGADLTHRAVAQASALRRRDGAGARRRRLRDARPGARGAPRRLGGHRGAGGPRRHRGVVPPARRPGLDELVGRGVYYGASASEAMQTAGDDVYVVGAANSAGQAALNFARYAGRVVIVVRGDSLEASMSQYLIARILATPNDRGAAADRDRRRPRRRSPRGHHAVRPGRGPRRGGRDQLALRLHRRGPAHRVARRGRRRATTAASCSPAPTCRPTTAGRWTAPPSRWRRACPACSPPATCALTR